MPELAISPRNLDHVFGSTPRPRAVACVWPETFDSVSTALILETPIPVAVTVAVAPFGVTVAILPFEVDQLNFEPEVSTTLLLASIADAVTVVVALAPPPTMRVGDGATTTLVIVVPIVRFIVGFSLGSTAKAADPVACAIPVPSTFGNAVALAISWPVGSGLNVACV
jgi:hypothetical protein